MFSVFSSYDKPPPLPCRFEYSGGPEEIKGHLPEQGIDEIFEDPGKPCPECIIVEMR